MNLFVKVLYKILHLFIVVRTFIHPFSDGLLLVEKLETSLFLIVFSLRIVLPLEKLNTIFPNNCFAEKEAAIAADVERYKVRAEEKSKIAEQLFQQNVELQVQ